MFASPAVQMVHLFVFIWAIASVVTAALSPSLIATLPVVGPVSPLGSALVMIVGGILLFAARLFRSVLLLLGLALVAIIMMVGSFTTTVQWAVPYSTGLAAISMTAAHLLLVFALVHNALVYIGPPDSFAAGIWSDE